MAINDLIPGSLSWMLFNMSRVHPVYDAGFSQAVFITDEFGDFLTDESGNNIVSEVGVVGTLTLIRWA